ncbi:hypothetical protein FGU71_09195 [Erythrobacter insulae]|uniref:DUF305 domain-containing protein n=1 Tax=Erythrobacter insulae TaxID=2584124 RepID=A0A547PD21_9SPHN|nr:hypothetical protein [Erythrobacter insulae]TRD12015.1 hypothetical protein FGU71_09195 [Erythrobacter insulae]
MKSPRIFAGALGALGLLMAGCTAEPDCCEDSETSAPAGTAELAERLAFMAGHVEAGIALYRAGEGPAGGPHLLHPVSESYAEEREGLDAIGFDPAPFEAVSAALEAGKPASEIEPQLAEVEANLAKMRSEAGGDPAQLIPYLMGLIAKEYAIGVTDGAVSDAGEYQDAWGFARVARQLSEEIAAPDGDAVRAELDALLALWPDAAPVPPSDPASVSAVTNQSAKVTAALAKAGA